MIGGVFASHSIESSLNEADVISSAESVDSFAAAVSAVAPLDFMPGCKDPTGIMLPQKPFHYCKWTTYFKIGILFKISDISDTQQHVKPIKYSAM